MQKVSPRDRTAHGRPADMTTSMDLLTDCPTVSQLGRFRPSRRLFQLLSVRAFSKLNGKGETRVFVKVVGRPQGGGRRNEVIPERNPSDHRRRRRRAHRRDRACAIASSNKCRCQPKRDYSAYFIAAGGIGRERRCRCSGFSSGRCRDCTGRPAIVCDRQYSPSHQHVRLGDRDRGGVRQKCDGYQNSRLTPRRRQLTGTIPEVAPRPAYQLERRARRLTETISGLTPLSCPSSFKKMAQTCRTRHQTSRSSVAGIALFSSNHRCRDEQLPNLLANAE